MKQRHEAATYQSWFAEQVQLAMQNPTDIPHEEIEEEWAAERAELLQQAEAKR